MRNVNCLCVSGMLKVVQALKISLALIRLMLQQVAAIIFAAGNWVRNINQDLYMGGASRTDQTSGLIECLCHGSLWLLVSQPRW